MKILYHHRTLSKDGQNVHIDEMVGAFRRAGHEVVVVGPSSHANAAFGSGGGLISRIRSLLPLAVGEVLEFGYSFLAFAKLWRAARTFKPDLLYERYNLFLLSGVWLHRLTGLPYALEVNAPLALERAREPGLGLPAFARWCEAVTWRAASYAFPVTAVLGDHVASAGLARARLKVIPNGIDATQFRRDLSGEGVRAQYGLTGKIVVGFTGFFRAWHGLPTVLEVLQSMQQQYDLHFLIVGDGDVRADLEREARERGVESRVTITGLVERQHMPSFVAAFDIALQPKSTEYASPLKLFEYMALGRAIVAPNQPNIREILTDNDNALLFTPGDASGLKHALERLISDVQLRQRLGEAAAATIAKNDMTWNGNASKVAACFNPKK